MSSTNVAFEIKRDEDLPEQNERERRYLSHAELLLLAKAADRFETLTLVLGYCGLRFGEAKRDRHVPVPEPVWKKLNAELPADPNAFVFPSRKGGFLPLGGYRWAFDNACDEVGIEGLVPHGLRHTTASLTSARALTSRSCRDCWVTRPPR